MLRRPPTAIRVTQEDVLAYDDAKQEAETQSANTVSGQGTSITGSDSIQTKQDRIGITKRDQR